MIPIDEQIEHQRGVCNGTNSEYENAKLASLEELKRIREVQVPDEPTTCASGCNFVSRKDYDTLRDLLKRESARSHKWEAEADKQFQYAGRVLEQANAAEATISAMLKLGAEPSEEMKALARTALKISSIKSDADAAALFSFMFAKLAEQAEGK